MLYFPINTVFIEGPDCAGKTTLINNLHKMTDYRWHLFDRSHLSRKLFSELYGRNTLFINDAFEKEVNNLNNMYVMLLPTFDEIEKRFGKEISFMIDKLTVNRSLQWDAAYIKEYYSCISGIFHCP